MTAPRRRKTSVRVLESETEREWEAVDIVGGVVVRVK